jgi:hypothetical protein
MMTVPEMTQNRLDRVNWRLVDNSGKMDRSPEHLVNNAQG